MGDFIYADPPYDVQFTQYSRGGFDWGGSSQGPMAREAPGTGGGVEPGYARIRRAVPRPWIHAAVSDAPRMISCNGNREYVREVLAQKSLAGRFDSLLVVEVACYSDNHNYSHYRQSGHPGRGAWTVYTAVSFALGKYFAATAFISARTSSSA